MKSANPLNAVMMHVCCCLAILPGARDIMQTPAARWYKVVQACMTAMHAHICCGRCIMSSKIFAHGCNKQEDVGNSALLDSLRANLTCMQPSVVMRPMTVLPCTDTPSERRRAACGPEYVLSAACKNMTPLTKCNGLNLICLNAA